ncbi:hypothetical protein FXO38_02686 [Capsicum annuum]|nr:hypothetical protein FXO38_02686 [Capsicum annuum]KAF3683246.1 hypothetical protein FXO37_01972 [Capsicum annuum]
MHKVHDRQEKRLIILYRQNQLVGPTDEVVTKLGSFLGTLEKNATLCPLDIFDWRLMDTKKDLWDYTQSKSDIPVAAKYWVLEKLRESW